MIPVKTVQSTTSAAVTYSSVENHPANTSLNQAATNPSSAM